MRVAKDLWDRVRLLMQGTSLTNQERECKLYDEFDKFAHIKGESLHSYYLRFTQLINDMNIYNMKLEQFQVNTKFLNSLPSEWSKFVLDVKLVRDLHTTNFDQLHVYLQQHELNANKFCLMCERHHDPLALVANHQQTTHHFNNHQSSYNNPLFQQQYSPSQSQYGLEGPVTQSVITHNAAYQADDLDAYNFNCDDIITTIVALMANLSHYGLDVLFEIRLMLYDGTVIANRTNVISIPDSEETLTLEEESRSKVLLKQSDPQMAENKVNTKLVSYALLNQLFEDYGKRFVPQSESSAEQAFWSKISLSSIDPSTSSTPFKTIVTKELPKAIISDRGTHFCNDQFSRVMAKYGVTHRLSTAYHPQTSGQVEVMNRRLKRILERTVGENRASWSDKLEDALWAFRTAFKTSVGCTPYRLIYRKACHLPLELEHKAYWVLKHANFDLKITGDHRKLQLNELNELRDQAYENPLIYKERTKKLHDDKIKNRIFNVGDQVLLFDSRIKIFLGKLKSRWSGPFTISKIYPYGTAKLIHPDGCNFKVNCHRLKHYHGGDPPPLEISDVTTFPKDN
nr:reverse transcriptase domain-containing protein [Tanacetum cinerariifolium]